MKRKGKPMNIIKTTRGRKVITLAAIAVITLAFTIIPPVRSASAAEPSEQVIFSGEGVTTDGLQVGFWVWCMPEGNSPTYTGCLLYTSDAADERSSVDLGGRRI